MKQVKRYVFFGLATLVALPFLPVQKTLVNLLVARIPRTVDVKIGKTLEYVLQDVAGNLRISLSGPSLAWADAKVEVALAKVYPGIKLEPVKFNSTTIESGSTNAMAFPSGRVFVTRALFDILTPNELTAVIAHEFGHVVLRHNVRGIVQALLFQLLLRAALHPDADGDGVQESFYEEIGGMLVEKHTEALEKFLNDLEPPREAKEAEAKFLSSSIQKFNSSLIRRWHSKTVSKRWYEKVFRKLQALPFLFATSQYSRTMELEADQVAQAVCRTGACTLDALSSALTKLQKSNNALLIRYKRMIRSVFLWRLSSSHPPNSVRQDALQHVRVPALVGSKEKVACRDGLCSSI